MTSRFSRWLGALGLALAASAASAAFTGQAHAADVRVILVGDSTMATRSGYGDALCARFSSAVDCINLAKGGRSSYSFRAEGLWDQALQLVRESSGKPTYVLIQFGHNDQPGKPGRSTDLVKDFPANMARYAQEVKELGGTPVLVTPLTRRQFKGQWLSNDLAPWAAATRKVAAQAGAPLLDLNADSQSAVQAMGEAEADTLAEAPKPEPKFDRTHLGAKGAGVFSAIVADELRRAVPALNKYYN
jgi:lysophospholipase L1-like esterase